MLHFSTQRRVTRAASICVCCVLFFCSNLPAGGLSESESPVPSDEQSGPSEPEISHLDRAHWAFSPLQTIELPSVSDPQSWIRNEIDRFVLQRLQEKGLEPSTEASAVTLVRRLSFDLTGLPPAPEVVAAFLSDQSPDAWNRLIDHMLASPAYGDRWAQHWLDLARYADTDGFEHDLIRPNAWRYRDWVIDALNSDLPWDQFVQLQIAGDLMFPDDPAAAIPTGFLLCGPDMPDLNLMEERRHNVLNEMTSTTGAAFMALQVGCAQCHNHMYDPISQADFYRLRAYFESTEWTKEVRLTSGSATATASTVAGGAGEMARVVREGLPATSHLMLRGDFRRPGPEMQPAFLRIAMAPKSPAGPAQPSVSADPPRLALAKWLTSPDHPLATRVIVNRLWQFHFGEGLVRTPNDFGTMGDPPAHGALLDWLAAEFSRRHWSLKQMHRLILSSATWRQSSGPGKHAQSGASDSGLADGAEDLQRFIRLQKLDPENRLMWRMNRQRLEGEAIRDAMLFVSGTLNLRRGGPGIRPPLPPELVATLLKNQWEVSPDSSDHNRRSIYLFVRRNLRFPLFEAYDRPDTNASCPQRNRSTIAPQALVLLNSEQSLQAAQYFAGRIIGDPGDEPSQRIERAFKLALARSPSEQELQSSLNFLREQSRVLQQEQVDSSALALPAGFEATESSLNLEDAAALTDLCLALFNLNEFIYFD